MIKKRNIVISIVALSVFLTLSFSTTTLIEEGCDKCWMETDTVMLYKHDVYSGICWWLESQICGDVVNCGLNGPGCIYAQCHSFEPDCSFTPY